MPINKDLNVSPYFDDFDETKNFHRVLFKPAVAVQVRELNQLQTILQNQIEKFGNNIYKRGTIIDGVNFIYYPNYSYIKIKDSQLDGDPAIPMSYISNFITDPSSNLTAHIINGAEGFEATDPDLKTLYLRYINSGTDGNTTQFVPGSTLKIYDYLDSINVIDINNGGSGFANNDSVVFCSALDVSVTSNNSFLTGETISTSGNQNFAILNSITSINGKTVFSIKPRQVDLSNTAVSSTIWQFPDNTTIIGSVTGATATVNSMIGSGATATVTTTADIGKIVKITTTYGGSGYWYPPYTTIKSSGTSATVGSRDYTDLDLSSRNYIAQVTVSNVTNAVGAGYAFGVSQGVIYQKGNFIRVDPQIVIVDKYSNVPDGVSVGFNTSEDIINSNIDQSLLDQSTGTSNEFAPGADRLMLTPYLVVANTDESTANEEFLSLADFSNGTPFRENRNTQFNSIETEMAQRTKESAGDYVLDEFLVTTQSTSNSSNEGSEFTVIVDPGKGYIDGFRVETKSNYYVDVDKGIDGKSSVGLSATINYGNYVYINEVAGIWDCNVGTTINLRDSAQQGISNSTMVSSGALTASGNVIGTARVRNIVYDSGETGTNGAIYRLYLFGITMNAGKSFQSIKGLQIGSTSGLADVLQEYDPSVSANVAILHNSSNSSLIVGTGSNATRNISNLDYVYRQTNETVSMANNGTTSFLLTDPTETFGYVSTTLSTSELRSVILVPTSNNIVFSPNTSSDGTAAVTSGSNTVTISSSSANGYRIGDWMAVFSNTTSYEMHRVTNKTSSGVVSFAFPMGFTNATATFAHAYPKNIPIGLHRISGASATTSGSDKTLNINLGNTFITTTAVTCSLTYDVSVTNATPQSKTAVRDNFVKIQVSSTTLKGPWCLGIPDIFRLKNVYLGSNSSVDTTATEVTDQFYIDHNQNGDYYDLGYLYMNTDSNLTLSNSSWLLVKFDAFTSSGGVYTLNSYVSSDISQRLSDDSLALENLGVKTNSFEVSEVHTSSGSYFDLLNCIDFRPIAQATASYANTASSASVNPSSTLTFSGTTKKFPLPNSGLQFDMDVFQGRTDLVLVNKDNMIKVLRGTPSDTPHAPVTPDGVILINKLDVPPYPCVPSKYSTQLFNILNKRMASGKYMVQRIADRTIQVELDSAEIEVQQPRGYTMADIGTLERRIQNLEYEVALTSVENDLKDQVIPSNSSPGLDRFKFGFFVDDYTTTNYSDTTNIEYKVDVVDSKVVPLSTSIGLGHGPKNPSSGECVQTITIINQNQASEPAPPPPPVVVSNTVSNTVSSNTISSNTIVGTPNTTPISVPTVTVKFVSIYVSDVTTNYARVADTGWIQFSSLPSTFTFTYAFGKVSDWITVQKRDSNGNVGTILNNMIVGSGQYVFNHDPSSGREYKIIITRSHSSGYSYTLNYPIDNIVYVAPTPPSSNVSTVYYDGSLTYISPGTITTQTMDQNFGEKAYCDIGVVQTVKITGLKPSTIHNIKIGDSATNLVAKPIVSGQSVSNSQILTDSNGQAYFQLMIDYSVITSMNSLLGKATPRLIPQNIYVSVQSTDATSFANFIVYIEVGSNTGSSNTTSTSSSTSTPSTVQISSDGDYRDSRYVASRLLEL